MKITFFTFFTYKEDFHCFFGVEDLQCFCTPEMRLPNAYKPSGFCIKIQLFFNVAWECSINHRVDKVAAIAFCVVRKVAKGGEGFELCMRSVE